MTQKHQMAGWYRLNNFPSHFMTSRDICDKRIILQNFVRFNLTRFFCRTAQCLFCSVGSKFFSGFYAPGSIPSNSKVVKNSCRCHQVHTFGTQFKVCGFDWTLAGKEGTIFRVTSGFLSASNKEIFYERMDWQESQERVMMMIDLFRTSIKGNKQCS